MNKSFKTVWLRYGHLGKIKTDILYKRSNSDAMCHFIGNNINL